MGFNVIPNRRGFDKDRADRMGRLYRSGKTLAEIGGEYGLSRERVRQILKRVGVSANEGGVSERNRRCQEALLENRKKAYMAQWGCTREQWEYLRGFDADYAKTPIGRFVAQRKNAEKRGIGWGFTLWQWWRVWETSGKWGQRGRNDGEYVMCRHGDAGDYEIGNVSIRTCNENHDEYYWRGMIERPASAQMARNPEHICIDREMNQ